SSDLPVESSAGLGEDIVCGGRAVQSRCRRELSCSCGSESEDPLAAETLPLEGRSAIDTGAGRYAGLGRAVALRLAREGADVAALDLYPGGTRNADEMRPLDDEIGWNGLPSLIEELEALDRR